MEGKKENKKLGKNQAEEFSKEVRNLNFSNYIIFMLFSSFQRIPTLRLLSNFS